MPRRAPAARPRSSPRSRSPAICTPRAFPTPTYSSARANFLLWQIAYSEFVCTDVLWPDFDRYELLRALLEFQGRDRRFGAVK